MPSLLPSADAFRGLVDGSRRGLAADLARAGLAGLAAPYAAAVGLRNLAYDVGLFATHAAGAPVISIGNLTLGGTGKTPLVAWVVRACIAAGRRPAIVSRGYRAAPGQTSDEAAELAVVVPGVPHLADRDRVRAATAAVLAGAEVVVLDDGFQHRRLARTLDILAVDATDPFGCGRLFPRGLLREPLRSVARAQAIVLTRADAVDADRRRAIRAALAQAGGGGGVWAEAVHAPHRLRTAAGREHALDRLGGRRVVACAGIGNPAAFRRTLADLGADVLAFRTFPDHHAYTAADVAALGREAAAARADYVVTTLKDLVKLPHETLGGVPLVAVEITLRLETGAAELEAAVRAAAGTADPQDERGAA